MKEWPLVCAGIFLFIALFNRKTRLVHVLKEQFEIYKDDRNNKRDCRAIFSFIIAPIGLSIYISHNLDLSQITSHTDTIITTFSLIATIPLSFLALLIDKITDKNKKEEKEVAQETFVSITLDIIYSMFVIGIVIVAALSDISGIWEKIIVAIIAFLVIKIALNILMILKRVFAIWEIQ